MYSGKIQQQVPAKGATATLAKKATEQSPTLKKHFPELDGIRGIAALMVMVFHYLENKQSVLAEAIPPELLKLSALGQTGVDLFFVLSGFLITRILLRSKSQEKFFSIFYARRSIRILPLYYFYLILVLLILPVLSGEELPQFWGEGHWYWWVYLQSFSQTFNWSWVGPRFYWTLAVEEHFYLVWPFLVYFLPRKQLVITSIFLIVGSFLLRLVMLMHDYEVFYFTLTRLDALSLGALLAVFEPQILTQKRSNRNFFLSAFFIVGIPLAAIFAIAAGQGELWVLAVKYPMTALVYTALIGFAITSTNDSLFRKICESRPLCFIGGISYGLYIYHTLCFKWFDQLLPDQNPLLLLPFAFLFSGLVAWLSFQLLEKPFLRLKRFFEYKPQT
ncbi:MAG: acyltransferase [Cyanobacteria bacterium J06555_13]